MDTGALFGTQGDRPNHSKINLVHFPYSMVSSWPTADKIPKLAQIKTMWCSKTIALKNLIIFSNDKTRNKHATHQSAKEPTSPFIQLSHTFENCVQRLRHTDLEDKISHRLLLSVDKISEKIPLCYERWNRLGSKRGVLHDGQMCHPQDV